MSRQAIFLASLAALLPGVAATAPAFAAPGPAAPHFSPPGAAVLTRTVWRSLSDGQQIVVTRRYAVRFEAAADGFLLDGALIEANVDAPAELAAFADIERSRPDSMFPIVLDRSGRIVSDGPPPPPETREKVAALMRASLGAARLAPQVRTEALQQVPGLTAASGAGTPVPADLFQAPPGEKREVRKLTLPGGDQGEVEVATRVDQTVTGTLSRQVERVVTTRLAGTTRVSRELWSLTGS